MPTAKSVLKPTDLALRNHSHCAREIPISAVLRWAGEARRPLACDMILEASLIMVVARDMSRD